MRTIILLQFSIFTLFTLKATGQTPTEQAQPIVAEGKRLYTSEITSWHGTDLFIAAYKDRASIGGYFSYVDVNIPKCIFYSKEETPQVIGTISFAVELSPEMGKTDLTKREFTQREKDLYAIRKAATDIIFSDTFFSSYENTNFNIIPLIANGEKKVYVLTGTSQPGVVIFGNDYLLTFDDNNTLISKKKLHKNILPCKYGEKEENGNPIMGAIHSHLPETGDFMTATDICTAMLYAKIAGWQQFNVVSEKYLNVWSCSSNELTVVPMDGVRNIIKDNDKKKKRSGRK